MSRFLDLAATCRAIRAECHKQGIDDDSRRALMRAKAGVSSQKDLDLRGAGAVLAHLHQAAGKGGRYPGAPATLDREPYYQKIEALLADMELPWAYAESIAENITGGKAGGIQRLAWVREYKHLRGIVSALMVEKKKRLRKAWAALDMQLAQRGLNREWCRVEAMLLHSRPAWPWDDCLETLWMLSARLS